MPVGGERRCDLVGTGRVRRGSCFPQVAGGKTSHMPKVDPESHEPMPDAPDGPEELRGGMQAGDPGLEGATENGSGYRANQPAGGPDDTSSTQLPAEKPSDK